MIIGHHLIWTGYGQWLPNDPRGSTSQEIRNPILESLGALHFGRKRIQPCHREINEFYRDAEGKLQHPLPSFTTDQIEAIGVAFAQVANANAYTVWACAIMPDHVHVLVRKHLHHAEEMITEFQRDSRLALIRRPDVPGDHPVWGGHGWKVYQDCPEDVNRTVNYINRNPKSYRLASQSWAFVTPYNNWPFHNKMRSEA